MNISENIDEQENNNDSKKYEGDVDNNGQDVSFTEYEISASPNDFNVRTMFDFIDSGVVKIPGFQRNYVWDLRRASKLIESLLIGIPIPQIFLYEQEKNKFLVIDGQQRYFTIYFFKKKRFPRKEKRFELRAIFNDFKGIPDNILSDNEYFIDFNMQLPSQLPDHDNKYNTKNYSTLSDDDRGQFDFRTIRNIVIKQNSPDDGDSVMFEIFNRLNSGGVNLKPQEIRTSLYHSKFYEMLYRINLNLDWRKLTPQETPDLNMKDVEILLRGFAMLANHSTYKPSLTKFLNEFSAHAKTFSEEHIEYLSNLFEIFVTKALEVDSKIFFSKTGGRFNISVYESIFVALCEDAYLQKMRVVNATESKKAAILKTDAELLAKSLVIKTTDSNKVALLKNDDNFINATQSNTASTSNVIDRLQIAKQIL